MNAAAPFTITEANLRYLRSIIHNGVMAAKAAGISHLAIVPVSQWIPFRLVPDPEGEIKLSVRGHIEDDVLDCLVEHGAVRVIE